MRIGMGDIHGGLGQTSPVTLVPAAGSSNIAEWIAWIAIGFGIVYALKPYTHDEKGRPIKKS